MASAKDHCKQPGWVSITQSLPEQEFEDSASILQLIQGEFHPQSNRRGVGLLTNCCFTKCRLEGFHPGHPSLTDFAFPEFARVLSLGATSGVPEVCHGARWQTTRTASLPKEEIDVALGLIV